MITFGTHKGKSYDHMIKKEKSYCLYVLKQNEPYGNFLKFQNFLKEHINKIYDKNELRNIGSIKCSTLVNYMTNDNNVLTIINDLKINSINVNKIQKNDNIIPKLFGQFIDYLIRYEISKIKKETFKDGRTIACLGGILEEAASFRELIIFNTSINPDEFNIDEIDVDNSDIIDEIIESSGEKGAKNIIKKYQNNFLRKSYEKLRNNNNVSLTDVLNVSIAHSIFFGESSDAQYANFKGEIIDKKSHKTLINYIQKKIHKKTNVLCNPVLSDTDNLGITADADLIIDDEIIDIKISDRVGLNINDFIQLIIYACLYYLKNKIICKKLTIYNPILGSEFFIKNDLIIIKKCINVLHNYHIR